MKECSGKEVLIVKVSHRMIPLTHPAKTITLESSQKLLKWSIWQMTITKWLCHFEFEISEFFKYLKWSNHQSDWKNRKANLKTLSSLKEDVLSCKIIYVFARCNVADPIFTPDTTQGPQTTTSAANDLFVPVLTLAFATLLAYLKK